MSLQVIMNVLASVLLVQRFDRKTLHAATEAMAAFSLFILGGYFYILETDPAKVADYGWLPCFCLLLFICAIALGVAPLVSSPLFGTLAIFIGIKLHF